MLIFQFKAFFDFLVYIYLKAYNVYNLGDWNKPLLALPNNNENFLVKSMWIDMKGNHKNAKNDLYLKVRYTKFVTKVKPV